MLRKTTKIIMILAQLIMVVFLISIIIVASSQAAVSTNVPGTPVSITPPADFELSSEFTGFTNKKTGASILVAIFPNDSDQRIGALFVDREQFTEAMKAHNFEITNRYELKASGKDTIIVYSGTQSNGNKKYDKWVTLAAHGGIYMVTLQSPEEARMSKEEALEAFRSIYFWPNYTLQDQIEALSFTFDAATPFKPQTTLMGTAVTLAVRPNTQEPEKASIYIIRGTEILKTKNPVLAQALYLASIKEGLSLQKVDEEKEITFTGHNGHMLIGTAKTAQGDIQDIILYTAIDDKGRGIYLQATAPKGELAQYRKAVDDTAASIKLKP